MRMNSPLERPFPLRGAFSGVARQDGIRNILTISKREITRLRSRFTGRSRLLVAGILALAVILSYGIYQQDLTLSKDLYNIGVSPDAPTITDERFTVISLDFDTGHSMLLEKKIDAYIDGDTVMRRTDDRSLYAVGALAQYLEKEELFRISEEYEVDAAFPLRIEIRHLKTEDEEQGGETSTILSDILEERLEPEVLPSESAPAPASAPAASLDSDVVASIPEPAQSASDEAVMEQLEDFRSGSA